MAEKDITWLQRKPFATVSALCILGNLTWILLEGKANSFLIINRLISEQVWDFFKYYTYIGEGWTMFILCLLLLLVKYRYALAGFISFAVGSAFSGFLKHTIFSGMLRPVAYFGELGTTIQTYNGVELHHYNTFPSGHSITVFSMFSLLTLITRPGWGYLWAFLAILGIYSRVVIGLHFVTDITAGAIIGWLSTWFAWRAAWAFQHQGLNGHWQFR